MADTDAIPTALEVVINRVRVPYLYLDSLIAGKETYREQDRVDLVRLRAIREAKRREGGLN